MLWLKQNTGREQRIEIRDLKGFPLLWQISVRSSEISTLRAKCLQKGESLLVSV